MSEFVFPSGGFIETVSHSNEECEKGVSIDFGIFENLPPAEEYFIKVSTESQAPTTPPYTVSIDPAQYTLSSKSGFSPSTIVAVDSVHEGETNTLLKIQIFDRYDQLLKTRYLKLKCIASTTYSTTFSYNRSSNISSVGPNGGSLIKLKNMELINIGSTVTGSDYFEDGAQVVSILEGDFIEILPEINVINPNTGSSVIDLRDKPITINVRTGCDSAESLIRRASLDNYIYLNKTNNWTYSYQNKTLLKFVNLTNNDDIIIRVPSQNQSLLPTDTDPTNRPSASSMYLGGRIYRLGPCVEDV